MEIASKLKYLRWIKNAGITMFFVSPFMAYWYVQSKMKNMEKGIYEDLKRIESKGKTLADIPRK